MADWVLGSCHCEDVRFRVLGPIDHVVVCNCSICDKKGFLHFIVPPERFELLTDRAALTTYTFNTGVAKHTFCRRCGVHPFYVPRSHLDGFSVNARCIDSDTIKSMKINAVDGRNWEKHYPAGRGEFVA